METRLVDGAEAEFVRGAVAGSALEAAAGHEHREAVGVVIAAVAAFGDGRAAEFAAPDHRGFVEEAAAFEVANEGGGGAVHVRATAAQVLVDAAVVVPGLAGAVVDVNGADAALDEAPRQDAAVGEGRPSVLFAHGGGLAAQIESLGGFGLHAEGGFHGLDAGFEEFVAADRLFVVAVELLNEVQLLALGQRASVAGFAGCGSFFRGR